MFLFCSLLGAAGLVLLDQLIKGWAVETLSTLPDIRILEGVLHLVYRENRGAAFSLLQNRLPFLIVVTGVVMLGLLFVLLTGRVKGRLITVSFALVLAGGIGNLIDRVLRSFVVDYIYFVPINFPVFNLADCCVVIGTGLLVVYLLVIEPRQAAQKAALAQESAPPGENAGGQAAVPPEPTASDPESAPPKTSPPGEADKGEEQGNG